VLVFDQRLSRSAKIPANAKLTMGVVPSAGFWANDDEMGSG
jgi:hypothetical protein